MRSYVIVHTNPYVGVTDTAGKLTLDQIPPGTYTYVAWHENLSDAAGMLKENGGKAEGSVTIEAGKSATLDLKFSLRE